MPEASCVFRNALFPLVFCSFVAVAFSSACSCIGVLLLLNFLGRILNFACANSELLPQLGSLSSHTVFPLSFAAALL